MARQRPDPGGFEWWEPGKEEPAPKPRSLEDTPTSELSYAELRARHPLLQLTQPSQMRMATRNVVNLRHLGTPAQLEEGRVWFPKAHELAVKGIKRTHLSLRQGAGLISAVSGQSEWEGQNVNAFKEMHGLNQSDWDDLEAAHEHFKRFDPKDRPKPHEVVPKLKGTALGQSSISSLVRAGRIYRGEEDPYDVLPLQTAPKQHHMMRAVEDPSGPHIPIDFRAHDIMANNMAPAQWSGRGIGSAGSKPYKSGKPRPLTRYEQGVKVYENAAKALGEEGPANVVQAQTWVIGKGVEKAYPTAAGTERVKGVARRGQPYTGPGSLFHDKRGRRSA